MEESISQQQQQQQQQQLPYHLPLHQQHILNTTNVDSTYDNLTSRLRQTPKAMSSQYSNPISNRDATRVWTHPSQKMNSHRSQHHLSRHHQQERQHIRPLVLDATESPSSLLNKADPPNTGNQKNKDSRWYESKPSVSSSHHQTQQQPHHVTAPVHRNRYYPQAETNGCSLHSSSPTDRPPMLSSSQKSGYLYKLGVNIPIYKRRFFTIQQPSLTLYYFLSPYDSEPRGCYNIYNARVEHHLNLDMDTEDEGNANDSATYRFAIVWDSDDGGTSEDSNDAAYLPKHLERIELESRSKQDVIQWIRAIEKEQVSFIAQKKLMATQEIIVANEEQIKELQKEISNYKYIEQERDDAVVDAARFKAQLEHLDESIRLLTQQIRRKQTSMDDGDTSINKAVEDSNVKAQPSTLSPDGDIDDETSEQRSNGEPELVQILDIRQVPGMYFSALHNAVEQLQDNIKLSSLEAATAVEDVTAANERVTVMEQRTVYIEKHLCKIWEENCSLRKTIKQIKREKRVLVREIKSLRSSSLSTTTEIPKSKSNVQPSSLNRNFTDEFLDASDEEKLINELEEHVISSIRLHEEYLASVHVHDASAMLSDEQISSSFESDIVKRARVRPDETTKTATIHPDVPLFEHSNEPFIIASLLDDSDNDSSGDRSDHTELDINTTTPTTNTRHCKAVDDRSNVIPSSVNRGHVPVADCSIDEPDRPNPLLHLDDEIDDNECGNDDRSNVYTESSQSESTKSRHIHQNKATYQLSCPLSDVITTTTASTNDSSMRLSVNTTSELRVYHITFYSRKIGIQFQRVPPSPVKANGLLTEAMTDDLTMKTLSTMGSATGGLATAAELRRIAAISNRAKSSLSSKIYSTSQCLDNGEMCELATPVDAVLVCGFDGFDESNTTNCVRPKLGARLVAFDGVSIEIGKWTFSAVRKAIQSCGRPLTLSFRNDYLTIEQRTILTKAVRDVDNASSAHQAMKGQQQGSFVAKDTLPTMIQQTVIDSMKDRDVYDYDGSTRIVTDDLSESVGEVSDNLNTFPQSFSCNRSVSSTAQYRSFYETRSLGSSSMCGNDKIRSFSEAGSATTTTATNSSVLSAIGPLVSSLLSRQQQRATPFTPEYLRRAPEFVEDTPQHQDFQSELL